MTAIFRYEWVRLWRDRTALLLLLTALLCGVYAIFYGHQFLEKNARHRQEEMALEAKGLQDTVALSKAMESPFFLWSFQKAVFMPENRWTGLSIGQADVFRQRFYGRFTMTYYQLFGTDIANPERLAAGNFDLAFVLTHLFPLLIIALSFSVLSGERDAGVLFMLRAQGLTERQLALSALALRWGMVLLLGILLSAGAFLVLGVPMGALSIGAWLGMLTLYITTWFAICFAVVALRRGVAFNAVALLTAWLLTVVAIPALLNLFDQASTRTRAALTQQARVIYEENLDADATTAYANFYRQRPHLQSNDTTRYADKWDDPRWLHIAYGISDDALRPLYEDYRRTIGDQIDRSKRWQWLSPALAAQTAFNAICSSDLTEQARRYEAILAYQEAFRKPAFDKFFFNKKLTVSSFKEFPPFQHKTDFRSAQIGQSILALLLVTLLMAVWVWYCFSSSTKNNA